MVDFATASLRTRAFRGFVQFQDSATYYRLKERQTLTVNFNFLREEHYTDDGVKVLDPAGHRHTFNLRVKMTSDFFDNVYSNSSSTKTLSYWIYKSAVDGTSISNQDPVQIVFVATMEALSGPSGSATEKYIHLKFTLDPTGYTFNQPESGGNNEIVISGEIISIQSVVRSASSTPP